MTNPTPNSEACPTCSGGKFLSGNQDPANCPDCRGTRTAAETSWNPLNIAPGLCRCGCGGVTNIASRNRAERGIAKGQSLPYMQFHAGRMNFTIMPNGCWIWNGGKDKNGYGITRWQYKGVHVHRAMYEQLIGPVPDSLVLDHVVCQRPACVNPAHLEPVTNAVNVRRGRSTPFSPELVEVIRASTTSNATLAKQYGVNHATIWRIRKGQRWTAI